MKDKLNLQKQIAFLQGTVEEGFRGVHARQDLANGRTAKIEARVSAIEEMHHEDDGVKKGIKMSWGFLVTIVTLVGIIIASIHYLVK